MYLYSRMSLLIVCKALSPKNIKSASNTKVEDFIPFLSYILLGRILGDRSEVHCKGFGFYSEKQKDVKSHFGEPIKNDYKAGDMAWSEKCPP